MSTIRFPVTLGSRAGSLVKCLNRSAQILLNLLLVATLTACGSSGDSDSQGQNPTPDTVAPSVPSGLMAAAASATSVALAWTASADNTGGSGLLGYRVYRNGALVATATTTTYTDTGLAAATTYSYSVSARDNALNESAQSTAESVTTPGATLASGMDTRPSNTTCLAPARPTGSSAVVLQQVAGFSSSFPVSAVQAPGDSTRWFVVERAGRIRVFNVASATMSTFVDLTDRVIDAGDEEAGLLGLAFHPNFSSNGRFFVFYSGAPASGYRVQSRIAEFTSANGTTVDKATERILIRANKGESNHNGGQVRFGPDGYLYASLGDGGAGDDPTGNGQNRNKLFGKILRIDVNSGSPYGIPAANPANPYAGNALCSVDYTHAFGGTPPPSSATMCPEIYAYGLRNPWRFSFDRSSSTPDIWVGDVGQGAYEEINRIQSPGGNFGWDIKEGPGCHEPTSGCASVGADGNPLINPIAAAPRSSGLASIIGGFVYRGSSIPALAGRYIFTDFFANALYLYDAAATNGYTTLLNSTGLTASSFAEDNAGELYLVDYVGGGLHRINPGGGSGVPPVPVNLSDTGCVNASNPALPAAGLIPYAPNAPFWSDGAAKERWLALPNGTTIAVNSQQDFDFPNGSVLVKNFRLSNLLVETRLFMKHPDGAWAGYSYRWNTSQTQATLVQGATTAVWGGQTWIYPSGAQCLQCHTSAAGFSLGLEIPQLNGLFTYPQTNRTANQITTLNSIGTLSPAQTTGPTSLPAYPDPHGSAGSLAERARAYLHTNCAQCHRPNGGTGVSLDLRHATLLSATATCNIAPNRGNLGIANALIIAPGSADTSVLLARMNRRGADQMPPIGSNVVDTLGVQLVRDWINGLGSCN